MQFSVQHIQENGLDKIVLSDSAANTSAVILPAFGAMLHELNLLVNGASFNVIANYADLDDIKADLGTSFKSSKLSPFACRIEKGVYSFDGRTLEFDTKFGDGNAIHGLLYNKPFHLEASHSDSAAEAVFVYHYDKQDSGYPWAYTCRIFYTLVGHKLTLTTEIINEDEHKIPLTDGWHPYFQLGGKANNWTLNFKGKGIVEFNERLIPTGKVLPYNKFQEAEPLADIELDNCFILNQEAQHAPVLHNPENGVFVRFHPDENYSFLQMYIPPHRNSIAIENLSGAPDCFNNNMGLVVMEPGTSKQFSVTYETGIQF